MTLHTYIHASMCRDSWYRVLPKLHTNFLKLFILLFLLLLQRQRSSRWRRCFTKSSLLSPHAKLSLLLFTLAQNFTMQKVFLCVKDSFLTMYLRKQQAGRKRRKKWQIFPISGNGKEEKLRRIKSAFDCTYNINKMFLFFSGRGFALTFSFLNFFSPQ